jgi:flagellar biosynthetic protein FlhB
MAGSSDRTEKPTARRLNESREKGQVARSVEAAHVAELLAAVLALGWIGSRLIVGLEVATIRGFQRLGQSPLREIDAGEVTGLAIDGLRTVALLVGPLGLTVAVAVVAVQTLQGGWLFAPKALRLNFGRLNPAQGIKRLAFRQGGVDLIRMAVGLTVVCVLSYSAISQLLQSSGALVRLSPASAAQEGWRAADRLLRQIAVYLVAIAAADYMVQKWKFTSSMKMTKSEVKEDAKTTDGNPEIKARVRRIQREMTRRRMMKAVPKATVVITNPTHFAVALEYQRGITPAPRVVAKGRNLVAQRIKDLAREHGVPVVENVALAQALFKGVEIGDFVPADLFEAVAEVLAYLIRLKQLVL